MPRSVVALDPRRVRVGADPQRAAPGPAAQRRPAQHRGFRQPGQRLRLVRQRISVLVGDGDARQPQALEPPPHPRDHPPHVLVRGRRDVSSVPRGNDLLRDAGPHSLLESSASLRASSSLQSPRLNRTLAPLHPEGSMVGITSYDTYIPMLRLLLATVAGGKAGGPEKAVANWDEDGLNAGTSEVQRNIIAQRVLGLPRA